MNEFEDRKQVMLMDLKDSRHDKSISHNFKELRFDEINVTPKKAKEMVLKGEMLVISGMTLK